ncbi:hypothetical protein GQ42DRAFT_157792 [Ramicandelaber brevisporus]|nr:hypothetical protein GQ42DRAFT_157792 [Ramicandelaber brevisporus]
MQPQTKRARLDPAVVAVVCQLFRLPRELLELIAAWFSRGEAVPVLTVNSTFHEIFAEHIWRRLDSDLARRKTIPPESRVRYGHLVRRMRITHSIPDTIDLTAAFPNLTHLWISFSRLAEIIKSSQGKCFERLCYLGTWAVDADYDMLETSDDVGPVLNWIDSRFETEIGLGKIEWEVYDGQDMQLPYKTLKWFERNGQLSRIHFKFSNEVLNFSYSENADFNAAIPHCLVDWKVEENDGECAAERFSRTLNTIPSAEQRSFTFPVLQRLRIGTCCDGGNEVYSQFNFGLLFPSVWHLTLDTTVYHCQDYSEDAFSAILAHPWPSVRKLDINGDIIFSIVVSHLAVLSNVEELSMIWESELDDEDLGVVKLCELGRALPKLVRLKIDGRDVVSTPLNQQLQLQLFPHLRYVALGNLTMSTSAINALVNAPLLTNISLEYVEFKSDDDVDTSNVEYHQTDLTNDQMDSKLNLDLLIGLTNSAVRSMDVHVGSNWLPLDYEDTLRAMIKCFTRLKVCVIHIDDSDSLLGLLEEFPTVKFNPFK